MRRHNGGQRGAFRDRLAEETETFLFHLIFNDEKSTGGEKK